MDEGLAFSYRAIKSSMQSQLDIDDALIAQFLGSRYVGRRYLRYAELQALGIVDNRGSLQNWMDRGGFPRGIRIPGPVGKTLVWNATEVARLIAQRIAERDAGILTPKASRLPAASSPESKEAAPSEGAASLDSNNDPFAAGRNSSEHAPWIIPPPC
jgi:hypothetical protein